LKVGDLVVDKETLRQGIVLEVDGRYVSVAWNGEGVIRYHRNLDAYFLSTIKVISSHGSR